MNKLQLKTLYPVLKLASKLILSPASIRFCDALISNQRIKDARATRIWYPKGDAQLEEICYGPMQNRPTSRFKAPVCDALEKLAQNLQWYAMTPKNKSWSMFEFTDAITTRLDVGNIGSDIYINYKSIETLRILNNTRQLKVRDINAILRLQLHLAITICHETIHALNHFIRANPPYFVEPFFNNSRITEMGFCWEQEVFGGEINWWWEETEFAEKVFLPITIMKWPSAWLWGDDFRDPKVELSRRWPKSSSTMFFVPMWWVNSLFQDIFWDDVEDREDELKLLHPPKTHGIRIFSGAPHHVDVKWRRSLSSERYEHDQKGRVVKYPELRARLTPSPPWQASRRASQASLRDIVTDYGELPRWVVRKLSRPSDTESDSDNDLDTHHPLRRQVVSAYTRSSKEDVQMEDRDWKFAIPGGGVGEDLLEWFGSASNEAVYEAIDGDGNSLKRKLDDYADASVSKKRKKSIEEVKKKKNLEGVKKKRSRGAKMRFRK